MTADALNTVSRWSTAIDALQSHVVTTHLDRLYFNKNVLPILLRRNNCGDRSLRGGNKDLSHPFIRTFYMLQRKTIRCWPMLAGTNTTLLISYLGKILQRNCIREYVRRRDFPRHPCRLSPIFLLLFASRILLFYALSLKTKRPTCLIREGRCFRKMGGWTA